MIKRITFDFETRSMCDLKKAGAFKYSLDPTTQPTCLAFKERGEDKVFLLDFKTINTHWTDLSHKLKMRWLFWLHNDYLFSAHNAYFERCIYSNILVKRYGWPEIPARNYRCTAAKAAACALPRNLEGAGAALQLTTQKDKRGYVAMMRTCKPTRQWNAWKKACDEVASGKKVGPKKIALAAGPEPQVFVEPEDDIATWSTLYEYCRIDVKTEELLDESLPDLIPSEQEIWHLNQAINWRGIRVDLPTIKKVVSIMASESKIKLKELDSLTMGLVTKPGARASILEFLALDGIILPDIRKKTVEDNLEGFVLTDDTRRLLEIRQALSMTSTKKYQAFINRANEDERVRDIQLYHGASTGRDSGTGVQVQNFPRGLLKVDKNRPYAPVENVVECEPEMLHILYGDSLGILFSAILRNMILPSKGRELFVADFSKIEVAVLWWLAGNAPGLKVLNAGLDPYIYQAMNNTGKKYEDITEDERQLAKAQILGCGFGMGHLKFKQTAYDVYRLTLSEDMAKQAVAAYRTLNAAVPVLWKWYEAAAIEVVETGCPIDAGKCRFFMGRKFLWVQLPSGRRLAYREPQISWRETEYGPRKTLEFYAVNSKTKKWGLERTWGGTLTENIVQAVARDLLMESLVRLEKSGYKALLSVHDEAICERRIGEGSVDDFVSRMCARPSWADAELPLDAKGWTGPRYRK